MPPAECLDTLGNVAGLAHEIRNALESIAVMIELVERDLPVTSPASAMVKPARQEIAHINDILTDLLQNARPHAPEVCPSDLNTTVERAVVLARQQVLSTAIGIEFEKDPSLPSVEHDSGQIHQVVLNLLLNAAQAIEGAGAIRIGISLLRGDTAITVTDTGCGIALEHLTDIFRPFYTTKAKGTGLGLSMARQIVEEHDGRIEVTSEVGKGSTFSVLLPLQQARAESVAS